METSKFNGNNVAKLDFNYCIRYRPRHDVYVPGMQKQIEKLFTKVDFNHLCYSWEKDTGTDLKHAHCLVQVEYKEDELIEKLRDTVLCNKKINTGERDITYTTKLNLLNPSTGEKICKLVEKKDKVNYKELIGKHGSVFIETIKDKISSSIYTMKYTDYGVNFGFIKGNK